MNKQNPGTETECQYLPEYIMDEIRLRLPAKLVARFRCVSKAWLSAGTDLSFLRAHSHCASKFLVFQSSIEICGSDPTVPALFTAAEGFGAGCNAFLRSTLPFHKLPPTHIELLASCDGLIFLGTYAPHCYYVVNPLTSQCSPLPAPLFDDESPLPMTCFGFYFHRWTGEYRLLSVLRHPKRLPFRSEVLSLGAQSWRTLKDTPPVDYVSHKVPAICLNDFLHWISYKNSRFEQPVILLFDTRIESFALSPLPPYYEEWAVPLGVEKRLVGIGLVDIDSRLGFYVVGRDKNCRDDLRLDVWLVDDYKIKSWTKLFSVSYKQVCCLLGLVVHWMTSALHLKNGELLLLFRSCDESFLVRCSMNSGKYCADQAIKVWSSMHLPILICRESLIPFHSVIRLAQTSA